MPTNALQIHKEDKKFFKYDHGENSMKALFIICANFAIYPIKKLLAIILLEICRQHR